MILTRHCINPSIDFTDVDCTGQTQTYDYQKLCELIDGYKNLLQKKYHCQPGQRAIISVMASIEQIALVFACAELDITITIIDYPEVDACTQSEANYVDPKTNLLLPIDFCFIDQREWITIKSTAIFSKLYHICKHTIVLDEIELDSTVNNTILARSDSTIMQCVNSSTTGAPELVVHTHEFISNLALRNSKRYSGTAGLVKNLQHGSSYATYFLPALFSKEITNFVNFKMSGYYGYNLDFVSKFNLNHLQLPWLNLVRKFFEVADRHENLTVYVLGSISPSWIEWINQGKVTNIVSFFGTAETGGPIFTNQLMPIENFDPKKFVKVDDFYQVELDNEKKLTVTLPCYKDRVICTNDEFNQTDNYYYHQGRSDLMRINDRAVDLTKYQYFVDITVPGSDLIYDTVENKIYLAVWKEVDENLINHLDGLIRTGGGHVINKSSRLNKEEFTQDGKIDQNLLLTYFRNQDVPHPL